MNYLKLVFSNLNDQKDDMITGFLFDKPHLGVERIHQDTIIYFKEEDKSAVEEFIQETEFLGTQPSISVIPHENWNQDWENNFPPIIIENKICLRASFHNKLEGVDYDIVINPKMSFGTGHHETTQMMMSYLIDQDCTHKKVLDFGSGTGVLGIFCKIKGALEVLGIDNDPWCIENAYDNASLNHVTLDFQLIDLKEVVGEFDLILANINLNIITSHFAKLKDLLTANGDLFLSGMLKEDLKTIELSAKQFGFRTLSTKQKGDWIALHLKINNI